MLFVCRIRYAHFRSPACCGSAADRAARRAGAYGFRQHLTDTFGLAEGASRSDRASGMRRHLSVPPSLEVARFERGVALLVVSEVGIWCARLAPALRAGSVAPCYVS